MPNVIADTSPIQYLYQINLLDLLPQLYGSVIIPQAVANELAAGAALHVSLPDMTLTNERIDRQFSNLRSPGNDSKATQEILPGLARHRVSFIWLYSTP